MGLLEYRPLQRLALRVLRSVLPVGRWGNNVWVARYAGVTHVLEHSADFSVVPIYGRKMQRTSGEFYLGMDDGAQYQRERQLTNRALAALGVERYRTLCGQFAEEALQSCAAAGELDVVQELSWVVPLRLCGAYFGVPGPDPRSLARWMRYIFQHLFLNLNDDPVVAERAESLSLELRAYLDRLIAEKKAELQRGTLGDNSDFLSELVRASLASESPVDDVALRSNLGGVVLGSVDTVSRCAINVLEELLERPEQLAAVRRAAQAGDRATVARYVFEALRFFPHNPLIVRQTLQPTTVPGRSGRAVPIAAGRRVFALTYSAMFDPARIESPERFDSQRGDLSQLQFGFGLHRCFGERLALLAVPEILMPLLRLEGLARVAGAAGRVVPDGPFPDHLRLSFSPPRDRSRELDGPAEANLRTSRSAA
jgi:cytochrome P450